MVETNRDFRISSAVNHALNYRVDEPVKRAPAPAEAKQFALELGMLWRDLVSLRWSAAAGFCSSTHCFLVLERHKNPIEVTPAVARAFTTLERVLTGESQKVLAYDESTSLSTVAARCALGLQSIGPHVTVSGAPLLFILAAHAARGVKLGSALVRPIAGPHEERWLVRCGRPDRELRGPLSKAERDVVRLLVEGRTHAQMSQIRDRSARTIANQLGSVFRKLGVSGRTALVSQLLRDSASKSYADTEQRLH